MPSVTLQVSYEQRSPDEVVCVTGSIPCLGAWSPDGLQPMTKQASDSRWSLTFDSGTAHDVEYRYAVCSFPKLAGPKVIIIHQWETNLAPRKVKLGDEERKTELQTFGVYGGESSTQRGWLVGTREIRLWFEKAALSSLTTSQPCLCNIRITAVDVTDPSLLDPTPITVLVSNSDASDYTPRPQADQGETIDMSSDIITFSTQGLPANHDVKFLMELLHVRPDSEPAQNGTAKRPKMETNVICGGSVIGSTLTNSVGTMPVYFFDDAGKPNLKTQVSYTVIEPLDDPLAHSLEVSYATYWNWKKKRTLNIGHRGMGKSHKDPSLIKDIDEDDKLVSVPENTTLSLKEAAEHGADYVEFDVHVTKDGCPVLFHDFQFSLCQPKGIGSMTRTHLAKLSIKDMTLNELSAVSKLTPVGAGSTDFLCIERTSFNEDELPFTKLQMALETVPTYCGFDIEIKYPMMCERSGLEYDGIPMDMNASIDAILKEVLKYGGSRRVFFSAFNPDVCAMIRQKQSKYPVMLCNYDRTDLYESYTDPRNVTVERSINTALGDQILGLCGHCEDYLADPTLVDRCHKAGLVVACWGERTIEPEIRQRLTEIRVDGIIHDRMGTFARGTKNTFMRENDTANGQAVTG